MTDYDYELRAHNERLRTAAAIGPADRVLDVGCGTGLTTREAARAASLGHVLGVDLSEPSIERARELTAAERLGNVTYEHGDAQTHPFAPESFDVAISRFGTMFFGDPLAAFANIARALRPGGRLVLLVWQQRDRNHWVTAIDAALGATTAPREAAFSLGDPDGTRRHLDRAGFGEIAFGDVREPVYFGRDTAAALDWVCGFCTTQEALATLTEADAARALQRLHDTLDDHDTGRDGVVFESRAWLITARRERGSYNHLVI